VLFDAIMSEGSITQRNEPDGAISPNDSDGVELSGGGVMAQTPAQMPPDSWLDVANTHLADVAPASSQFPNIGGSLTGVIDAWSGAALDTSRSRLLVWGGGHNDYGGNEIYAFDVGALKWLRLTDPSANPANCMDANSDGTPSARHTYDGLAYISHADQFFGSGGALTCNAGGCGASGTWTFDFASSRWTNRQPSGSHTTACGDSAAYDPDTKRVWWGDGGGLYAYDYDSNAWTQYASDYFYYMTATVDTHRGILVFLGNGNLYAYDLKNANYTRQSWTTTGDSSIVSSGNPGVDYDPTTDRIVAWSSGKVFELDPSTKAWTTHNPAGAPAPSPNGTYGRWRYVPQVNAFVLVTAIDADVHFYKLSAGAGAGEDASSPTGDASVGDGAADGASKGSQS
jgi:hypothetical protein